MRSAQSLGTRKTFQYLICTVVLYRASCYYHSLLLPTDVQENFFKRSIKIYIKSVLAKVSMLKKLVKIHRCV